MDEPRAISKKRKPITLKHNDFLNMLKKTIMNKA